MRNDYFELDELPTETYFIYDSRTGDCLGEVLATSEMDAEEIAAGTFLDHSINDMEAIAQSEF